MKQYSGAVLVWPVYIRRWYMIKDKWHKWLLPALASWVKRKTNGER